MCLDDILNYNSIEMNMSENRIQQLIVQNDVYIKQGTTQAIIIR